MNPSFHVGLALFAVAMSLPALSAGPDPLCGALERAVASSNVGFKPLRGQRLPSTEELATVYACNGIAFEDCSVTDATRHPNPGLHGPLWIEWSIGMAAGDLPALARRLVVCLTPMRASLGGEMQPVREIREVADSLRDGHFAEPAALPGTRLHTWVTVFNRGEAGSKTRWLTFYVSQADRE